MRKGWERSKIGDWCEVVNGGTPRTGVADYWGGPHAWITPAEMGRRLTPYVSKTTRTLTDAGIHESSAQLLPPLSVILSSRAPIGHLVINRVPMATNQGCKGLVPREDLDHKFLFYYLTSIVSVLEDLGTGTTFKELSGSKLKEVPIPVPPLFEQHRIVALLDEAFAGIAKARENTERNLENAREVFESELERAFSQTFPDWETKTLREVGSIQTGTTPPTSNPLNYGSFIPFIKPSDFNKDGSLEYAGLGLSERGLVHGRRVAPNSVLMVCIGATIGKCGMCDREVVTNQQINSLTLHQGVDPRFVYYQMRTLSFQQRLHDGSAQATLPIINKTRWSGLTLLIPSSLDEQMDVVQKLRDLEETSRQLMVIYHRKLAALDALKQSLLHQAFHGDL